MHAFGDIPKNLNFVNEALINKFSSGLLCDVLVDQIVEQINNVADMIFLEREQFLHCRVLIEARVHILELRRACGVLERVRERV